MHINIYVSTYTCIDNITVGVIDTEQDTELV